MSTFGKINREVGQTAKKLYTNHMPGLSYFPMYCRNVYAIGRNYADHAAELGNSVPKEPFFFMKPTSSIVRAPSPIELPANCEVHHEVELGVVIGRRTRNIKAEDAMGCVGGYLVALDMTARNLQKEAKANGMPWALSKSFETFTGVSSYVPKHIIDDPHNVEIWLQNSGKMVQKSNTSNMIFKIPQLIEYLSSIVRLERYDVILTGTPAGVASVKHGDTLIGGISLPNEVASLQSFRFPVVNRSGPGKWGTGSADGSEHQLAQALVQANMDAALNRKPVV